MLKVSAVSYLNTKPFLKGLAKTGLIDQLQLSLDIPSHTAQKLINQQVDLALVPVAILAQLPQHRVVSKYCIGAVGAVKTVSIYSDVPINQITHLLLDYHSRTSVALAQILCLHHWRIAPQLVPATMGFEEHIGGTTAGVVIGDRTIELAQHFAYNYDLSLAWQQMTQLPFVFAAWVAAPNAPISDQLEQQLNHAFQVGIDSIDEVVAEYSPIYPAHFDLHQYLTQYISYPLDAPKQTALKRFLEYVRGL